MSLHYQCPHCGSPIDLDETLGAVCGGCDKFYAASDSVYLASAQAQYNAMSADARQRVDEQRKQHYEREQEAKKANYRMQKSRAKSRVTLFSVLLLIFIAIIVIACQYAALQPVYGSITIVAFSFFSFRCIKSIWDVVSLLRSSKSGMPNA